jgi:hypothetical protein
LSFDAFAEELKRFLASEGETRPVAFDAARQRVTV